MTDHFDQLGALGGGPEIFQAAAYPAEMVFDIHLAQGVKRAALAPAIAHPHQVESLQAAQIFAFLSSCALDQKGLPAVIRGQHPDHPAGIAVVDASNDNRLLPDRIHAFFNNERVWQVSAERAMPPNRGAGKSSSYPSD